MLEETSAEFRSNRSQWIDCKDTRGRTPLIVSARRGYYQVAELLIHLGASLDIFDNVGCTALHEAVYRRHDAVATMLVQQGASPFIVNMQGSTAMDIVCKHGYNAGLLRQIENRAIFCGWLEQKVRKLGLGHEWVKRWIVIAQRLSYQSHGSLHDQPRVVQTVLISYDTLDSVTPTCKCCLDGSHASVEHVSHQRIRRNRKMLHAVGVHLAQGHPSVRGAAVSKSRGRITLYFRPVSLDDCSLVVVSNMISYVNWASGLNSTNGPSPEVSPVYGEYRPHWAFEPPQLLQTGSLHDTNTIEETTRIESSSHGVVGRMDSGSVPESSQDWGDTVTHASQGTEKECLICMDNKIEVVFCHDNETYVA